jgi:hypothetical protein
VGGLPPYEIANELMLALAGHLFLYLFRSEREQRFQFCPYFVKHARRSLADEALSSLLPWHFAIDQFEQRS